MMSPTLLPGEKFAALKTMPTHGRSSNYKMWH